MIAKILPLVSIVIPIYNAERYLSQTLQSVRNQTFQDWECILVDDGSTDGSADIACAFTTCDRRFRLVCQSNGGVCRARNRGIGEVKPESPYITFMDNDDLWLPNALERMVSVLQTHPEVVGVHCLAALIDGSGISIPDEQFSSFGRNRTGYQEGRIRPWPPTEPTTFSTVMHVNRVYPPGVLLARKWAYDRIGNWDTTYSGVGDWDIVVRLTRLGPLHFLDEVLVSYRRHDKNESDNRERNVKETRHLHHKVFFSPDNTAEQKRLVREGWGAWQIFKMEEKRGLMREAFARRQWIECVKMAGHLCIHAYRYLRGYPTPKGI